jgi:hypothetical protein
MSIITKINILINYFFIYKCQFQLVNRLVLCVKVKDKYGHLQTREEFLINAKHVTGPNI